jgi:steroid delta-isomerase-like uncharacterized protein
MARLRPDYAEILARHVTAESARDMEATLATLTEDCCFEDMPTGEVYRGREGVRTYYARWWSGLGVAPDGGRLHVIDESTLWAETRFLGTHIGSWEGIAPTGRSISLRLAILVTFADGLMSGERFYYDRMSLLQQIGHVTPSP